MNLGSPLEFKLPFTIEDASDDRGSSGLAFYQGDPILSGVPISIWTPKNSNKLTFYAVGAGTGNGSNFYPINNTNVNGEYDWITSFTYMAKDG